jgi:hypothetical protein
MHNNSGKERADRQKEIQRNGLMHQRSDNGRKQVNINQNNPIKYGNPDKSTKKFDEHNYGRRKNETKQKDINKSRYNNENINNRRNKKDYNSVSHKYSDDTKMHPSRENYNKVKNSNNTKTSNNSGEKLNRNRASKNK